MSSTGKGGLNKEDNYQVTKKVERDYLDVADLKTTMDCMLEEFRKVNKYFEIITGVQL